MVREPHHERGGGLFVDGALSSLRSYFGRLRMSGTVAT
jgi:hypothetical protein